MSGSVNKMAGKVMLAVPNQDYSFLNGWIEMLRMNAELGGTKKHV
jgi:hypothetical protein